MLVSLAYTPISDIALAWENEEREEEKKEKEEEEKEERNGAVHTKGSYRGLGLTKWKGGRNDSTYTSGSTLAYNSVTMNEFPVDRKCSSM